MVLLNPLIFPIGRNLWLRFAFFDFLKTWVFRLPAMPLLHAQTHPFWHASTHKFSLTQTGSQPARTISRTIPASAPVTCASFPTDQIVFLRAGACGF